MIYKLAKNCIHQQFITVSKSLTLRVLFKKCNIQISQGATRDNS